MVMDEEMQRRRSDDDWGRFKLLSESLVDVVWTTDLDLNFTYLSPSVKKVLGYTPKEVLKMTAEEVLTGQSLDEFGAWYVDALEGEADNPKGKFKSWTLELENLRKEGDTLMTECTVTFIRDSQGRPTGILGVTRDISQRWEEQCTVNDALSMYKSLFESSRDGIIHTGLNGNIIDANRAYLDMLGYSLDEIRKLSYSELTPAKWREAEKDIITNQIAKRGYSEEYEKEYIRKDGTVIPIAIRVWLIIDSNGKPAGFWAISRDITTRKELEEQMVVAERRLSLITENTSDLITVLNLDGTISYTSPSYNKLYYSEYDLQGTNYFDYLKPDDQEELMNFVEGALLDTQEKIGTYFEYYIKDKVGKWHLLESTMNLSKTEGGIRGAIVIISRLSTKKRRSTKRSPKKKPPAKSGGKKKKK